MLLLPLQQASNELLPDFLNVSDFPDCSVLHILMKYFIRIALEINTGYLAKTSHLTDEFQNFIAIMFDFTVGFGKT